MKICLFNGMSGDNNIEEMIISNLDNHDVTHLNLREMNIGYCRCCDGCSKLGRCVQNDEGGHVVESYKESEIIIFLTPVRYGAYSKELKKAVDRLLPIGDSQLLVKGGYMIHRIMYNNKNAVVIGVLDKKNYEAEGAFNSLVRANYYNMDWKEYRSLILHRDLKDMELENKVKSVLMEVIANA